MQSILLIDPSVVDASVLASALRAEGFGVVTRSNASGAREALGDQPFALAVLDLMVRDVGRSGLDLARELRASYPDMRVLLTSSYHLGERQLERAHCGVSGFIPKPYDLREVVDFVGTKAAAPPSSRRLCCAEPEPRSGVKVREPSAERDRLASSS